MLLAFACACGRDLPTHVEPDAGGVDAGPGCDLFLQNCPKVTEACYPRVAGFPFCAPVGSQGEGAPCTLSLDCVASHACVGGAESTCQRLCAAVASTNTCGEGQRCTARPDPAFGVCSPGGAYSACVYSGGLDHLTIRRSEPARGLCTLVSLASPGTNTEAELSLPPGWEVQTAVVSQRDGGCSPDFTALSGVVAQKVSGRITFFVPDGGFLPTRADAFLSVFPTPVAGLPQAIDLIAADVPLGSCF